MTVLNNFQAVSVKGDTSPPASDTDRGHCQSHLVYRGCLRQFFYHAEYGCAR